MSDIVDWLRSYEASRIAKQTSEAADTIEALRAENARLREALKPFADKADKAEGPFEPPYPADYPLWRAARAAYREEKNNG